MNSEPPPTATIGTDDRKQRIDAGFKRMMAEDAYDEDWSDDEIRFAKAAYAIGWLDCHKELHPDRYSW